MNRRELIALTGNAAAVALLCGCGGSKPPPPPPPTTVSIKLTAAADVNPDGTGAPEPLRLRILQLADTGALSQADFFGFDADPAKALGADLLGSQDIVVRPGQTVPISPEPKPGVKFIGVVGAYYAINKAHWRAWSPVKPNAANSITITLKAFDIDMTGTSA